MKYFKIIFGLKPFRFCFIRRIAYKGSCIFESYPKPT